MVTLLALWSLARSQEIEYYTVGLSGTGGLLKAGSDYAGTIAFGMVGVWTLEIDDSLWPDAGDTTARFEHIWETYFAPNYDATPGLESWRGYFNSSALPASPRLTLRTDQPGGDLVLNAPFVLLVRDYDGNGALSPSERRQDCQLSMTCSVEKPACTEYFYDYCGNGGLGAGDVNLVSPPATDEISAIAQFQVWYCGSPVSAGSWVAIKTVFR
jgi:hypothetical protein